MEVGQTVALGLHAFGSSGASVAAPNAIWSTSAPSVAAVTLTGTLTAIAQGGAVIRAFSGGGLADSIGVQVTPPTPTDLLMMPRGEFGDTILLAPGASIQMSAYAYFQRPDSSFMTPIQADWTSSEPGVASAGPSGLVTAIVQGTATIRAAGRARIASRTIRVVPSAGTVSVRFVHAGDGVPTVTLHGNTGTPLALNFGDVRQETFPAGTLQFTLDRFPLYLGYGLSGLELQQFTGFVPANTQATILITNNPYLSNPQGPVALAPLWDWSHPVSPDSAQVRVVLATYDGYNVFLTPPGGKIGVMFLQGCYLDWPYGVTEYSARAAGAFDIVLERKWQQGKEAGRFRVTPEPGHATTYVLVGRRNPNPITVWHLDGDIQVWHLVDR